MPKKQGKNSLTDRVREIIRSSGPGGITKKEIAEKLDMVTRDDKEPLYSRLRDLLNKSKEIEQKGIRPHFRYFWVSKQSAPTIQEKMWRVLRARKAVTLEDLMELAGASETYAKEYMQMLARNKIVKHDGKKWRMIADPGPTAPDNAAKAEKLRKLREARKAAIAAMDEAFGAIARARMAMVEMEVET